MSIIIKNIIREVINMIKNLKGTKTYENLAKAFAGECQAGARYQFMAEKAENEGYCALSQMIKMLSKNEMAHAKVFYDFITDKGSEKIDDIKISAGYPFKSGKLCDELAYAAENEKSETEKIYPSFAKTAQEEDFNDIATAFTLIARVENGHKNQLSDLAELFKKETIYKKDVPIKWKCSECGHEEMLTSAWQICPVCHSPQGYINIPISGNN